MPHYAPPKAPPGDPQIVTVARGTLLYRIHDVRYDSTAFNPTVPAGRFSGGRFDSIRPDEPFLYVSASVEAAVCEVLLRQVPTSATLRRVPRAGLRGKRLATLRAKADLQAVSLRGAGLSALGQDAWLTSCEAHEYESTRRWSDAIRGWAPDADGFEWRSRRNQELMSYIFFETSCGPDAFEEVAGFELWGAAGLATVREVLEKHYFTI